MKGKVEHEDQTKVQDGSRVRGVSWVGRQDGDASRGVGPVLDKGTLWVRFGNAKRGGGVLQGGIHGHGGDGLLRGFLGGRPVGSGRRRSEMDVIRPDFNQFECFWKFLKAENALVQMERTYCSFVPKS